MVATMLYLHYKIDSSFSLPPVKADLGEKLTIRCWSGFHNEAMVFSSQFT